MSKLDFIKNHSTRVLCLFLLIVVLFSMVLFKRQVINFYINHFVLGAPAPHMLLQPPHLVKLTPAVKAKPQPLNDDLAPVVKAPAVPAVKAKATAKIEVKPKVKHDKPVLPAKRYAIQLLGSSNRVRLEGFVAAHKLAGNTTIVATKRDNKAWYILVYGHYATADQARSAIKQLSPELRKLHPWIISRGRS
ncbi:MAG: SPOR domain-containing protein [Gammaproteobacteria bacterium]|nr:SPOR domain-containing protein [Gammaproteobacteria bacterium]